MTSSSVKASNTISRKHTQSGSILSSLFMLLLIIGMVLFTLYVIKLDRTIVDKFEGKRWNIPAKVYSKPLTLYQGASLSTQVLDEWLKLLNYRQSDDYNSTGSYSKQNGLYYIHTRGFNYDLEDKEVEQVIKLNIANQTIQSVQSTQQNQTGILRLEPINIGGIYPDNNEDRIVVQLADTPQPLIDALIATEDRSFYTHKGVSLRGIARAVINNFSGKSMQGGSTITQQLIKNFYLNSERTLSRKANEALMALLLEVHYGKNDILQTYLNEINLGQNGKRSINGFGLASQFYFNRPLTELRVDQQALLVGLAKGPSFYNPRRNPERAIERRNIVLNNMLVTGKLSQQEYDTAITQPLDVSETAQVGLSLFPDFLDIVKRELNEVYQITDLKNEGLQIISTLDPTAQIAATTAVDKKIAQLRQRSDKTAELQGALVSADPQTGELSAIVGGADDFTGFNRAVDANRQVGSLLKPIIYMTAIESGRYNLASKVNDEPINITTNNQETWRPKNYDGVTHPNASIISALSHSYNQAAVNVGMEFGIDNFIKQLHRLGIEKEVPAYPSALLGANTFNPVEMLGVYQILATGGFRTPLHSIRSVTDNQGRVLQRTGLNTEMRIAPKTSFLTNYALQQVVKDGTAKKALSLGAHLNLAGKTGTTNDYRDAWFAGYSGNYVTVVWVGRDDNQPIGLSGSSGALPVWIDYMKRLKLTAVDIPEPEGIEWLWLEDGEGTLSNEQCPNAKYLPVASVNVPKNASSCAVNIYEQEQIAAQQALLAQQALEEQQEETEQPIEQQEPESENLVDRWFEKALEWF